MGKLLVYGMGNAAGKFVRKIAHSSFWQVVAITDSTINMENRDKHKVIGGISIPVIAPEEIGRTECDYIIIGTAVYEEEIRRHLKELLPDCNKVLSIGEFYYKVFLMENKEKLQNNSLYDFCMNKEHTPIDKWLHYYRIYDRYFSAYRGTDVVFLEIGVCKGGSLQMWKQYFGDKATIIGVDIDEMCKVYEGGNAKVEIGSQEDPKFWEYIKNKYPRIDILLDDGGHTMNQQIVTFECMFPFISDGGIYMCEDTHTSYMEGFGAEYGGKNFIEYSKKFIDDMHAYFSQVLEPGYNTESMYSVHYYDSIVVVEKEVRSGFPIILKPDGSIMDADMNIYKLS